MFQVQAMVEKRYYQNVRYVEVKNQDLLKIKELLSNLGVRTPLSKIPVLGDILF